MARQPKKPKGPGTGRPGVARKYAKDKKPTTTAPTQDQDLKTAMQTLRADQPPPHLDKPTLVHQVEDHHQPPEDLEIDFTAAITEETPNNPDSPLVDNNIYIYNKNDITHEVDVNRERINEINSNNPKTTSSKKNSKKLLIPEILNDDEDNQSFDLKSQLTLKELKFLELYLTGDYNQVQAMKLAGYNGYNEDYLGILARKIICKHESQVGDHRKIMRAMGYGETKVIGLMIEAATTFKSETVKQRARETLGKWLGLSIESVSAEDGIVLVIKGIKQPNPDAPQPQPPGQPPSPGIPQASGMKIRMIK